MDNDRYRFTFKNNGTNNNDLTFLNSKNISFSLSDTSIIFSDIEAPTGSEVFYDNGAIIVSLPNLFESDLEFINKKFLKKELKRTMNKSSSAIPRDFIYLYLPDILSRIDRFVSLGNRDYFVLENKLVSLLGHASYSEREQWLSIYKDFIMKNNIANSYF